MQAPIYSVAGTHILSDYGAHLYNGSEGTKEILCKNEELLENTQNDEEPKKHPRYKNMNKKVLHAGGFITWSALNISYVE